MKTPFIFILLIHGLIHFTGFSKAFQLGQIDQLLENISKPTGMFWLLPMFLFLASAIFFYLKTDWWSVIAIAAVLISQILIIIFWEDAKFGTIANVLILFVSISSFGNYQFNKMVRKESTEILQTSLLKNIPLITENDLEGLPEIVQKWMRFSGVVGKEKIVLVRLKQQGHIKTNPKGNWMYFTAKQYFNVANPAFIWTTKVDYKPLIKMIGRDKFTNGEGEILIKLVNVIPIVNEGNNKKINPSAMLRYLAEIAWFPSAAINHYIYWETIDKLSAKATFKLHEKIVSGIFKFSEKGQMISFEAKRYYGAGKDATLETWFIQATSYKNFNGITIPNNCKVIWKLKQGDFNWLKLNITALQYNKPEHFKN